MVASADWHRRARRPGDSNHPGRPARLGSAEHELRRDRRRDDRRPLSPHDQLLHHPEQHPRRSDGPPTRQEARSRRPRVARTAACCAPGHHGHGNRVFDRPRTYSRAQRLGAGHDQYAVPLRLAGRDGPRVACLRTPTPHHVVHAGCGIVLARRLVCVHAGPWGGRPLVSLSLRRRRHPRVCACDRQWAHRHRGARRCRPALPSRRSVAPVDTRIGGPP